MSERNEDWLDELLLREELQELQRAAKARMIRAIELASNYDKHENKEIIENPEKYPNFLRAKGQDMTKPLWENKAIEIYGDRIAIKGKYADFPASRGFVLANPYEGYRRICGATTVSPDLLYEAFLMLATYWDLQCDFDELRKIRDEMKEPAE